MLLKDLQEVHITADCKRQSRAISSPAVPMVKSSAANTVWGLECNSTIDDEVVKAEASSLPYKHTCNECLASSYKLAVVPVS